MLAIIRPGFCAAPVGVAEQRERLVVGAVRALGLELHQRREALAVACAFEDLGGLDVEPLQLVHRQVDAAAARVVADVANDVGELHRQAEAVRVVDRRRVRAAEDVGRDLADDAGDEIAVAREAGDSRDSATGRGPSGSPR